MPECQPLIPRSLLGLQRELLVGGAGRVKVQTLYGSRYPEEGRRKGRVR